MDALSTLLMVTIFVLLVFVLAQGLPTESFLDMQDRSDYAHGPGPIRLYPDFASRMWEAYGCAKLVVTGPELAAARATIEACGAHASA